MGKSTDTGNSYGQMAQAMEVSLTTTRSAVKAPTHGPTRGLIKALGRTIKWTGLGFSRGRMAVSTSASTRMTTNTGMAFLRGQMVNDMRASGARATSMAKELARYLMGARFKASGRKERSL